MVEVITYSLRNGKKKSDGYYLEVAAFTDEVVEEMDVRAGALVDEYMEFLRQTGDEELRPKAEYAFEVLTLGTLWRLYIVTAMQLKKTPQRWLAWLAYLRRTYPSIKPAVDILRGIMAALILFPTNHHQVESPPLTIPNLDQLIDWLDAAGDFREEVKRLRRWREFLASQSPAEAAEILDTITKLAAWFEERSLELLGHYTPNIERFLEDALPRYKWREDRVLVSRKRVEYHLNMVGTEILNRGIRKKFLNTSRKLVLLPPCMTAKPAEECKATSTPYGEKCAACTPGCRVHQATKLGEKYGFEVLMLPPELSVFSSKKEKPGLNGTVGIVGASCPLTNVTGGWQTRDMGVPAQGILLDYVGCPWHWDLDNGIPTDINFNQLLRILDLKD
jgi:hypothetical protein